MSALTKLDVVNDILAQMGEASLNAIDDDHPFVAVALRAINTASRKELGRGWWFNTELVTLVPDPGTGFVYAPGDVLSIDPIDTQSGYVYRDRRLYDAQNETYVIAKSVPCKLVRDIPFEHLPSNAQLLVSYSAQKSFEVSIDADQLKAQMLEKDYKLAYTQLRTEDIRNTNANLLYRPSTVGKFARIGNYRRY